VPPPAAGAERIMTGRRLLRHLGLAVAYLAVVEGMLRWGFGLGDPPLARLDPATEYELVGPAEYRRWGNRIAINADGLRMPPLAAIAAPDERRVLLVGDSVIYGNHFLDQSQTIAIRMADRLAAMPRLAGCRTPTLPVAVSSWGPVNQAAFLAREGSFGAQAAGIVVSAHDLFDVPRAGAGILPYRTGPPPGALGDVVLMAWERRPWRPAGPPPAPLDERAAQSLAALDRIVAQLRDDGIEPVLFYHPTLTERAGPERTEATVFRNWAGRAAVAFADLGAVPVTTADYLDDIHPGPSGADLLATALADRLGPGLPGCPP